LNKDLKFRHLFLPNTATTDCFAVVKHLQKLLFKIPNLTVFNNTLFTTVEFTESSTKVITPDIVFDANYVINCAGQHSIKIAHKFNMFKN